MPYHRTQLLLDPDTYQSLLQRAQSTGRSLSDVAREYLRKALEMEEANRHRRLDALQRLWDIGGELVKLVGHPPDEDVVEAVRSERLRDLLETER